MATAKKRLRKRKCDDESLIRLNSLGFSLATIGATLGCHTTTVSLRLKDLGIPAADTRRCFMEDIIMNLPPKQLEWLEDQLGSHTSIKDYVGSLLLNAYIKATRENP